ncbi:nitric oxide-associated protein 1 [Perognathus longimembris pacificus]|uniref:nitric oxide-associated protein 1 n=1 Tax=Perognathus longimembris pacificus TaxID=214514 RepID=UPI00201996B7|nr:nitric oxide-associated protein 1 [Perognathus longimembris pacificus]
MLPALLTRGLLRGLARGSAAPVGRTPRRASFPGRRGLPQGPADSQEEGAVPEERFLFPEYAVEPASAPTPEERLRELRRRLDEEERQRLRRREERLQRQLRAGLRAHRDPEPEPEPGALAVPPSGRYCSGCGAELHCQHPDLPGYLPADGWDRAAAGGGAVCRRCWLLVHHRRALRLRVSRGQYRQLVSAALRRPGPALVLYVVDLLDLPDPLMPDLPSLVGPRQVIVLGNKVDLLPQDAPGYLQRLRRRLWDDCARAGLALAPGHQGPQPPPEGEGEGDGEEDRPAGPRTVVRDVRLISAKTGYGIEELISALQRSWRYRGDVYLVGATNTGKSTLFNTLLESDYCTAKGAEAIDRATISPWPGTTLNLLKFPICNPTPYRMFKRHKRLQKDATKTEEDLSEEEQKQLNCFKKDGYIVGRVGRTFLYSQEQKDEDAFYFDADSLAYDMGNEPVAPVRQPTKRVELTPQDVKDAHWFYDTPGITKENCILNLLTDKEVNIVLPTHSIVPRTFVLKPGMVLFLGAIGRIDFLQGNQSAWFTVVASSFVPVHITSLDKADAIYQKHAGHALLQVPVGGEERMAEFPPLVAEDITLKKGLGECEAVADIKFSSAGWVAVTPNLEDTLHLRVYTPQGTAATVRPPVLPYIVNIKGHRIKRSVAYKTKRLPSLVCNLQKKKR